MIKKLSPFIFLLFLFGCAHVVPPKPPFKKVPVSPKIDNIYVRGEFLHILATLPTKNSDNSPVKFYRRIILKSGKYKKNLKFSEIEKYVDKTLNYEKNEFYEIFSGKNKLHFKIETKIIFPKKERRFLFLEFINDAGRISPPSNVVYFNSGYFISSPELMGIKIRKNFIDISWKYKNKDNIDGFNIYKTCDKKTSVITIKNNLLDYKDREFSYGKKYTYKVDAYKILDGFKIYSYFSKPKTVKPIDIFPPDIPQNPSYLILENSVKIFWDPSLDTDLKGYFVYKKIDDKSWEKVNSTPLKKNIFIDSLPEKNVEVKYRITAIDLKGNESKPSKVIVVLRK